MLATSESCTNTAIRMATRRVTLLYDNALGEAGIRSTQFSILAAIDAAGSAPTIRELAASLAMEASALGHTLKPLAREGWVRMAAPDSDRRAKRLTLTEAGRAKLREGEVLWQSAQDRIEQVLGAKVAADLRAFLLEIANDDRLVTLD